MATVNLTGFETQSNLEFQATFGTFSYSTSTTRTGGASLRVNPGSGATGAVNLGTYASSGAAAAANVATSYVRFYFRFAATPAVGPHAIFTVVTSAFGTKGTLRLTTAGKIEYLNAAGTQIGLSTTVLSTNTWYMIGMKCGTSATVGAWDLLINGVSEASGTANLSATNAGYLQIGRTNNPAEACDHFFDDVTWDDASMPGNGQIAIMTADGDGTYTNGTANGAATKWQCIDEVPHDADTTYIDAIGNTNAYTATMTNPVSSSTVRCVSALVVTKTGSGTGNLKIRMYDSSGPSTSDTSGTATSTTIAMIGKVSDNNPSGSGGWSVSDVGNLQLGVVENSATGSRVTAVYGMVDHNPVTPTLNWKRKPRPAAKTPSPLYAW